MKIACKIRKIKDVFHKVLKKLLVNFETCQIKVLKLLKMIRKVLKSFRKSPKSSHINWQVATQHDPKNRRDFTTNSDINNVYDFIT